MSNLEAQMPGLSQLVSPSSSSSSSPPAPVPPALGVSPISLSFTAQQGGSNPTAQTVSLSNTGGGITNRLWLVKNNFLRQNWAKNSLEPISKLLEQHRDGGKLDKP